MTSRTVPIRRFKEKSGLGHTKTYELLNQREIKSFLVGKRRLIDWDSWLDYLERQQEAEENGIGRIASPNPRAAANRSGSGPSPAKAGQKGRMASPAANDPAPARQRSRGRPPKPRATVRT